MENDPDVLLENFKKAKKAVIISAVVAVLLIQLSALFSSVFLIFALLFVAIGQLVFFVIRFAALKSKTKKMFGGQEIDEGSIVVRYFPSNGTLYSPEKPVDADLGSGFVYPGMREGLSECAKDYLRGEHHVAIFRIKYRGTSYMEIYVNPGFDKEKNAMTLDWLTYVVHFNPKRFRSGEVLERFEKCSIFKDFAYEKPAKSQGHDARIDCGMDREKAMKIASYLFSGVCYFPLDTQLAYDHVFLDFQEKESESK